LEGSNRHRGPGQKGRIVLVKKAQSIQPPQTSAQKEGAPGRTGVADQGSDDEIGKVGYKGSNSFACLLLDKRGPFNIPR